MNAVTGLRVILTDAHTGQAEVSAAVTDHARGRPSFATHFWGIP